MPDDQLNLDEQILSQVAESRLSDQLEAAEQIEVDVHTDLLKAVQGKVNSVSVQGKGLVVKPDIRIQELSLTTDSFAIDLLTALLGDVKLSQPINTAARMVFTQADINQTLNSEYVQTKLVPLSLETVNGVIEVELKPPLAINLPAPGKVEFSGTIVIHTGDRNHAVDFTASLLPPTPEHPLLLEAFRCHSGQGVTLDFIIALMEKFRTLLNLPYLDVEGTAIRLKSVEVQPGSLTLQIEAYVRSQV